MSVVEEYTLTKYESFCSPDSEAGKKIIDMIERFYLDYVKSLIDERNRVSLFETYTII
ncbi:MAG: hypothetical protein JW791_02015 [Nanoarchaeota archaeon]|nr:hypothetical protein [Nanoarchaeota archaeon]